MGSIFVGDAADSGNSSSIATGVLDLRGGTADILATKIYVARTSNTGTNGQRAAAVGTMYFDAGLIDTTTMYIGYHQTSVTGTNNPSSTHTATAVVNVSGTANLTVGTLNMARYAGGTSTGVAYGGTSNGTLNVSGGTVNVTGNINAGPINAAGAGHVAPTTAGADWSAQSISVAERSP